MRRVVIVEGLRTAVGKFGGMLKDLPAQELGAIVIRRLLERTGIKGEQVNEVIMGNVLQAGLGQNPARQAAVRAGVSVEIPSFTVNKVCGSGLKAITLAAQSIALGDADIIIAGGMENMSQAPYLLKKVRWGCRMGDDNLVDSILHDGLWCIFGDCHMAITAENIADRYGISREEQDEFAAFSQQKAEKAIKEGKLDNEIVPVTVHQKKGEAVIFKTDEFPRAGTTKEKLAGLKPAFRKDGTVTAGNSSGINDGAAAVAVMSEEKARELGLKPKAFIRGFASAGVEPSLMGMGPVPATQKVLKKTDLRIDALDLIEANEAFAVQSIAVGKELGWDNERVNVNGGAIAFGHPIGATGAKILVSLLYEMERRGGKLGLVTLCIGGGQGIAAVLER